MDYSHERKTRVELGEKKRRNAEFCTVTTYTYTMEEKQYPQLNNVELCWHVCYWDRPQNGVASYNGKHYWFVRLDNESNDGDRWRIGLLYDIGEEAMKEEEETHELFRKFVGTHTDYVNGVRSLNGTLHPQECWSKFYSLGRGGGDKSEYKNSPVVGWFKI